MTKAELIDKVAGNTKLTKKDSDKALTAMIGAISGSLAKGDKVQLVGFGSFEVRKRAARKGRNPRTGKEINIKAKKVAKFKAGAELSKKVNK